MAETLKHNGLDLPVFPSDTPICFDKAGMRAAATTGADHFVRQVHPYGATTPQGLGKLLYEADQQFEELAEHAGARVVPHTYGIYEMSPEERQRRSIAYQDLLPAGHLLVAEVAVVQGFRREINPISALLTKRAINTHNIVKELLGRPYLYDMHIHQFGRGRVDGIRAKWLVDIEPKLVGMP